MLLCMPWIQRRYRWHSLHYMYILKLVQCFGKERTLISMWPLCVLLCSGLPYTPASVQTEVTTTTANISWRVPEVDYNPEDYTVAYYGLDLQSDPKVIQWLASNSITIPTAGFLYYVVLNNLEEDNTYNYSVQATDCRGAKSKSTFQFTTLPDGRFQITCIPFHLYVSWAPVYIWTTSVWWRQKVYIYGWYNFFEMVKMYMCRHRLLLALPFHLFILPPCLHFLN